MTVSVLRYDKSRCSQEQQRERDTFSGNCGRQAVTQQTWSSIGEVARQLRRLNNLPQREEKIPSEGSSGKARWVWTKPSEYENQRVKIV